MKNNHISTPNIQSTRIIFIKKTVCQPIETKTYSPDPEASLYTNFDMS